MAIPKGYLEVRNRSAELLGYLPKPFKSEPGTRLRYAVLSPSKPHELRVVMGEFLLTVAVLHHPQDTGEKWLALRADDVPLEMLRSVAEFIEHRGQPNEGVSHGKEGSEGRQEEGRREEGREAEGPEAVAGRAPDDGAGTEREARRAL